MKNIRRPLLLVISLLVLLTMTIAACATAASAPEADEPAEAESADVDTSESEDVEAEEGVEEKEPVTLVFLAENFDIELKGWAALEEAFHKYDGGKYSYIDIQVDAVPYEELSPKIESSVSAGATFDLVQADGPEMKHYAYYEAILPLDDYYTDEEMQMFFPESIEEGSYKGSFYGPPMMQSCSLLYYNKELTDAAGITPPEKLEDAWTMDEALAAWQKTTIDEDGDGVPEQWGLQPAGAQWPGDYQVGVFQRTMDEVGSPTFNGVGPDGITFTGYHDTPEAVEGWTFYQKLFTEYKVTPLEAVGPVWDQKQAAFLISPDNRIGIIEDLYGDDFDWGVSGHPYAVTPMCLTGSWHYGISSTTEHFEEALAFVKFATSDEGAMIWYNVNRQLPANVNIFNDLPEYQDGGKQALWLDAMNSIGYPRVQTPCHAEYNQIYAEMGMNIKAGADVAEEMHQAAQLMDSACASYEQ